MALPGTKQGFAFKQPAFDQPPLPYVITGALGTGSFVVTGNALVAPDLSVSLQVGTFTETGNALSAPRVSATIQKGAFTLTGNPLAASSVSVGLQRGAFVETGKALVGPSLSDQFQGGAFVLTGYPLGGGVIPPGPPASSTGAGWRRRHRRVGVTIPSVPTPTAMKAVEIVEDRARELDARETLETLILLYSLTEDDDT